MGVRGWGDLKNEAGNREQCRTLHSSLFTHIHEKKQADKSQPNPIKVWLFSPSNSCFTLCPNAGLEVSFVRVTAGIQGHASRSRDWRNGQAQARCSLRDVSCWKYQYVAEICLEKSQFGSTYSPQILRLKHMQL